MRVTPCMVDLCKAGTSTIQSFASTFCAYQTQPRQTTTCIVLAYLLIINAHVMQPLQCGKHAASCCLQHPGSLGCHGDEKGGHTHSLPVVVHLRGTLKAAPAVAVGHVLQRYKRCREWAGEGGM